MNDKIAIRFGHTLLKNGSKTSANGIINEYDAVREFGPYVVRTLTRAGYDVVNVTPASKKYDSGVYDLKEGINAARLIGCKLFVSLHLNAASGTARGAECLYKEDNAEGKKLAECIQAELVNLGLVSRGAKGNDMLTELNTSFVAVIVEGFFCDNKMDVELYKKIGPEKFGQAISTGIIKYLKQNNVQPQREKEFYVYGTKVEKFGPYLIENYAKNKANQLKIQGYENIHYEEEEK